MSRRIAIRGVEWIVAAVVPGERPWLWLVHPRDPNTQARYPAEPSP